MENHRSLWILIRPLLVLRAADSLDSRWLAQHPHTLVRRHSREKTLLRKICSSNSPSTAPSRALHEISLPGHVDKVLLSPRAQSGRLAKKIASEPVDQTLLPVHFSL